MSQLNSIIKKLISEISNSVALDNNFEVKKVADTINGAIVYRVKLNSKSFIVRTKLPEDEFCLINQLSPIFLHVGLNVPKILNKCSETRSVLMQDLGDESLLDALNLKGEEDKAVIELYQQSLRNLIKMQIHGFNEIKAHKEIIVKKYDRELIKADVEYFIDNFLLNYKKINTGLDKLKIELEELINYCSNIESKFFYYRDCMTRNIMNFNGEAYFIDFIGGRPEFTGCFSAPLEASVVTLIEHLRANTSSDFKEYLIEFYLGTLIKEFNYKVDKDIFLNNYYSFLLIKMLQNLGTYSKHGVFKNSEKFSSMIPNTIIELKKLLNSKHVNFEITELKKIIHSF